MCYVWGSYGESVPFCPGLWAAVTLYLSDYTLPLPCPVYCTMQGMNVGCEVKESVGCRILPLFRQKQGGEGGPGQDTACGERTVSLHMDCILPCRPSSLHCRRYNAKERCLNLRSSLSEGTGLSSRYLMF